MHSKRGIGETTPQKLTALRRIQQGKPPLSRKQYQPKDTKNTYQLVTDHCYNNKGC